MRLLFLGPPGAGKGTQAVGVAQSLNIPHIATGNMLREAVAAATPLGLQAKAVMAAGDLVSDDLVIGMLMDRIALPDASNGFILDGFPRNVAQAEALATTLDREGLDAAVLITVDDDEIVRRISGRRTCPNQHVYHQDDNQPLVPDVCNIDGETLYQRDDDQEDVVRNRLDVYRDQTEPLVAFYRSMDLPIHEVNGVGSMDEIQRAILETISA